MRGNRRRGRQGRVGGRRSLPFVGRNENSASIKKEGGRKEGRNKEEKRKKKERKKTNGVELFRLKTSQRHLKNILQTCVSE